MTVAVTLVLGVLLVAWLGPTLLTVAIRLRIEPQAALTAWLVLVTSMFLTLTLAVLVLTLPAHRPAQPVAALIRTCWTAVSHGAVPTLDIATGVAAAVLLALVTGRVLLTGVRTTLRQRRTHRRHLEALRGIAERRRGDDVTLWVEHPEPLAYSLAGGGPGTRPLIVASRGLSARLPQPHVAAVLDHERAHLAGRHHLLVTLADTLGSALPQVPMMRRSPVLVRMLVELAADRTAARSHGVAAVRAALVAMGPSAAPEHALGAAGESVTLRLAWLDSSRTAGGVRRSAGSGVAGLFAALLPVTVGVSVLAVAGLAVCVVLLL